MNHCRVFTALVQNDLNVSSEKEDAVGFYDSFKGDAVNVMFFSFFNWGNRHVIAIKFGKVLVIS